MSRPERFPPQFRNWPIEDIREAEQDPAVRPPAAGAEDWRSDIGRAEAHDIAPWLDDDDSAEVVIALLAAGLIGIAAGSLGTLLVLWWWL